MKSVGGKIMNLRVLRRLGVIAKRRSILFAGTGLLTLALGSMSYAQEWQECEASDKTCETQLRGKVLDDSSKAKPAIGENTERETVADEGDIPFSISVDGEEVDRGAGEKASGKAGGKAAAASGKGDRPRASADVKPVDQQRRADVGLSSVDIQVKYDGLESKPALNISTMPVRRAYKSGERVDFLATSNYPAFIEKSEIRIFEAGSEKTEPPVQVIPVSINNKADWVMPAPDSQQVGKDKGKEYSYILRVYDAKGRYDETVPLTLARTEKDLEPAAKKEAVAPGMGEDRTASRNIQVYGGAVTVYGRNVPPGYSVRALNETIPIDSNQSFVVQRILPPGEHDVDVSVLGSLKGSTLDFNRQINIPKNDWFYVGLADLTVGKRTGDNHIEDVRPGEFDDVYTNGRLAFYVKGKIKGRYLLTAAADTGEDKIENMFKGLDAKDPRQLLRRLDPDDYYPVYGDDSSAFEDAPTKGKFYVRLERGDSHVMWGNYKTTITGTEFMQSDRGLYGASAVYRSEDSTSFGERKTEVTLYAAQPDTLPHRDEFLGSGSFYWMKQQDITVGSETVTVEIRDAVTGRTIERRTLRYGEDYTFDYMQGTLLLKSPVFSQTANTGPVNSGGNKVFVVAQYEFTPVAGDVDGYVYGGRAQHWINEKVRVGVTGMDENTGDADQQAYGADIQLRHSEKTFIEAEVSHSKGPGFGTSRSYDGGLTLEDTPTTGSRDYSATAWRTKAQLDMADVTKGKVKGTVGGYYEEKEKGFSTLSEQVDVDQRIWGAYADVDLTEAVTAKLTYDDFRDDEGKSKREGDASVSWQVDEYWKVSFGVTYTELNHPTTYKSGYNGDRLDAGVRLEYRPDDDQMYYAYGQGTLSRSGDIRRNDRVGVGTEYRLTEKLGLNGEISYGSGGLGGLAAVTYDPTADDHYYIGYRLDPNRAFDLDRSYDLMGSDWGEIVGGVKRKLGETASAYVEDSYDMFGKRRSLNQT